MEPRLELARDLARQAGEALMGGFGRPMEISHKGAVDLVTEYDLRAEELLVEGILGAYPGDAILAEERGAVGQGDVVWYLDPIDGTTNFAHGLPFFAVSIGCARGGEPLAGVVYDPVRRELFEATRGGGAWAREGRLEVSKTARLDGSLLATGLPYDLRTSAENNLDHFTRFSKRAQAVRRLGSAALELAYVAAGRLDGFWELRLSPWDVCAGWLLVREASGTVTDTEGQALSLAGKVSIVASNGEIHAAMLALLRGGLLQDPAAPS